MNDGRWWYERSNQRVGPFTTQDLSRFVQAGLLTLDTVVVDQYGNQVRVSAVVAATPDGASPKADAANPNRLRERTAADYPPPPPLPQTAVGPLDKPVMAELVADAPRCSSQSPVPMRPGNTNATCARGSAQMHGFGGNALRYARTLRPVRVVWCMLLVVVYVFSVVTLANLLLSQASQLTWLRMGYWVIRLLIVIAVFGSFIFDQIGRVSIKPHDTPKE